MRVAKAPLPLGTYELVVTVADHGVPHALESRAAVTIAVVDKLADPADLSVKWLTPGALPLVSEETHVGVVVARVRVGAALGDR